MPTPATRTATPIRCSARTGGGPWRTQPATSSPGWCRARACSTSAADRERSPRTSLAAWIPGGSRASTPRPTSSRPPSRDHAAANLAFRAGDVYRLDEPDASYDVVHAHQVLQHLADPVAALVEMRRVCRPGGTIAVRDADYRAMTWWPESAGLERWLDMYRAVDACQRRRAGRRPPPRRLGDGRRALAADAVGVSVVLRHAGRPSVVGGNVGPALDRLSAGRPCRRARRRVARRAGGDRRGVASVGGGSSRLLPRRPRRGARRTLTSRRGSGRDLRRSAFWRRSSPRSASETAPSSRRRSSGGAAGNRTRVHQPVGGPATTIPDIEGVAPSPAGRMTTTPRDEVVRARSFPGVSRLSGRQWSFPPSSPASVAGLRVTGPVRHCCSRCLSTHLRIRRRQRTALRQFLLVPRLASLSNSGRSPVQRH